MNGTYLVAGVLYRAGKRCWTREDDDALRVLYTDCPTRAAFADDDEDLDDTLDDLDDDDIDDDEELDEDDVEEEAAAFAQEFLEALTPEQTVARLAAAAGDGTTFWQNGQIVMPRRMTCRVCGCSDARACDGGCVWAAPNLCSRCIA